MMQVAGTVSFSLCNYHWNSIKLCKIICIVASCPTPPDIGVHLKTVALSYFIQRVCHLGIYYMTLVKPVSALQCLPNTLCHLPSKFSNRLVTRNFTANESALTRDEKLLIVEL